MSISPRCGSRSSKAGGQGSARLRAQVTLATDVTFFGWYFCLQESAFMVVTVAYRI